MASGNPSYRIRGFDGLRALAVFMVWLAHRTSLNSTGIGGAGVTLFFVLSGFLIVDILRRQRENIEQHGSTFFLEWKRFVSRRAYRIFPVYFLFLAIVIMFNLGNGMDATAIVMHIFYLVNIWADFVLGDWNSTTTHLWSLSVEEQFYIFFPLFALSTPSKKLPIVCAAIIGLGLGVRTYLILSSSTLFSIDIFSFVAFVPIALGGLCVLLLPNRTPEQGRASALPAALLAAYIAIPIFMALYGSAFAMSILKWLPMSLLIGLTLVVIQRNQASFLVKLLEITPIRAFGMISYGFYVYHYPLTADNISKFLHIDLAMHLNHIELKIIEFVVPLLAAIISWRYIEKPILQWRPSVHQGPHELPSKAVIDGGRA